MAAARKPPVKRVNGVPPNKRTGGPSGRNRVSGRPAFGPDAKRTVCYAALLAVLLFAAWYSLSHINAPSNLDDDTAYMQYGLALAHGTFMENANPTLILRSLMIAPIGVIYALFGFSQFTSALWSILCFLGSILLAFFIGKLLYGEYVGVVSALLLSFMPTVSVLATTVDEMVPFVFVSSLSMLCLILGMKTGKAKFYFCSGLAAFASFLVSPLGAITALLVLVYLAFNLLKKKEPSRSAMAFTVLGLACGVLLAAGFNVYSHASPLIEFTSTYSFYSSENVAALVILDPIYYLSNMFPLNLQASASPGPQVLYYYLLIPAAFYLVIRERKKSGVLLYWFAFALSYLAIGPMHLSFNPFMYYTIPELWRYLDSVAMPLVLIVAAGIVGIAGDAYSLLGRPLFAAVALVSIALVGYVLSQSFASTIWLYNASMAGLSGDRQVAAYLSTLPFSANIYLPSSSPYVFTFIQLSNMSRTDNITLIVSPPNCTSVPKRAYVYLPYEWYNSSATGQPAQRYCGWDPAMYLENYGTVYYTGST
ncbi:MAG: glycosyltransferase family 39 protein [Candidatus Micrarchaeota archaeon]|nr:glycosyltransferase family 39 protein [Candidatus Micrarchaeota archaeon]